MKRRVRGGGRESEWRGMRAEFNGSSGRNKGQKLRIRQGKTKGSIGEMNSLAAGTGPQMNLFTTRGLLG